MSNGCLGDVAAALVDGELDHAARERAHRHLAHCAGCRAEVDGQRRLKARLSGVDSPELPVALTERLLGLTVAADQPGVRAARPPSRPPAAPSARRRPARSAAGSQRPSRARRAARRRATTGSALALLGVAAALALGAPPPRAATTPVDPATDAFVTEFVRTTAGGSTSAVVPVTGARTAGVPTFVPLTRTALLSTGGVRTTR